MLSWLYWNPQRELFTIPYIERPIAWYGLFFALGFVLGYIILLHVCRFFFAKEPFFMVSDVSNWARFLMTLRNKKETPFLHNFLSSLPNPLKEKIFQWDLSKEIDKSLQKALIFGMNHYLEQPDSLRDKKAKRLMFEELFPCSLEKLDAKTKFLVERLCFYTIIGTIVGARLGHILFYEDLIEYAKHPLRILKTWEGGLASHGALVGIVIAFLIFLRTYMHHYPRLNLRRILDCFVIPAALGATLIRVGNFFNQEVLGVGSELPWAVVFGNPADGSMLAPRHPAQLYEAAFYFIMFLALLSFKSSPKIFNYPGRLSGIGFTLVFTFRFIIEFFKEEQSIYYNSFLNIGQLLSIPFILLGLFLYCSEFLLSRRSRELFSQHTR